MKKQNSIKRNFVMNMILTISSFLFPLITFPYVSRILLPEGVGKISFATSLISYFNIFAQLGIPTYGVRACARVRDDRKELTRTTQELLIINLVMNVISYVALFAALVYVPRLQKEKSLYVIISFTMILTSIGMEWLYKALEQYTYITVRSVAFKLIALIAMFLLIHEESDYILYGGISIFAGAASNIFNFFHAHKYIDFKLTYGYKLKRHFKPILLFLGMSCALTIYTNLDSVMLGFIKSDIEVGYYQSAVKIKLVLLGMVNSLGAVLLPRSSYYIENGMIDKFRELTRKAVTFVMLLSFPLMLYFMIFAREGIYFLCGEAYTGSITSLQILMPTIVFMGITYIFGEQVLIPQGKEKYLLMSEIAGAVVDVVFNALLIPGYGAAGAAFGAVMAEISVFIVQFTAVKKEVDYFFYKIHYLDIVAGMILGTAASFWVKILPIGNFVKLFISAVLFFGGYGVYLLLRKEEMVVEIWKIIIDKFMELTKLGSSAP